MEFFNFVIEMKKPFYILIALCGILFHSNASTVDSLQNILKNTPDQTITRADLLHKLSKSYYSFLSYPNAIQAEKQALDLYKTLGQKNKQLMCMENLGIYYSDITDFEKSFVYLFDGLKLVNKKESPIIYNSLLFNLATTYIEAGNNKQGLFYLKKCLKFYRKDRDHYKLAAVYSNIGAAYMGLEDLKNSTTSFQKALQLGIKYKFPSIIGSAYINLGNVYYETHENQKALTTYQLAIYFFEKGKDERGLSHTKVSMANVYKNMGDYPTALALYNEYIPYFKEKNDLNELVPALKQISDLYEKMGQTQQSYSYFREYTKMKDNLSKEDVLNKMAILKIKFDNDKIEKANTTRIELLEKKRKINLLQLYILIGITIVISLVVFIFYTKNKYQKILLKSTLTEKTYLQEELKYRFSELEFFALHIVQKNNLLTELKNDFKALKGKESTSSDINSIVLKINNTIKKNKDLELFSKRVDEVNASFYKILESKFPDLTNNEKKLCTLIKLNLTCKEIAVLNDVSEGAITMARYRLRKKLEIEHDENLNEYLQNVTL